jgi:hypothetical protein
MEWMTRCDSSETSIDFRLLWDIIDLLMEYTMSYRWHMWIEKRKEVVEGALHLDE